MTEKDARRMAMEIIVEWAEEGADDTLMTLVSKALTHAYDQGYEQGHDEAVGGAGDE